MINRFLLRAGLLELSLEPLQHGEGFTGAPASAETAREIAATVAAAVEPMSDRAASAPFRRQLAGTLGARVLARAFADAGAGGRGC